MKPAQNTHDLKAGQTILFTVTGVEFKLAKVTDKMVSWYVGFEYKGGCGKNTLRMASTTLKRFNKGIEEGSYKILN